MKRIKYLDAAKGIAVSLMVLGHALGMCDTSLSTWLIRYIYCFHMPLFFIIYGFFYDPSDKDAWQVIRKRAKRYLIPYFFGELCTRMLAYLKKSDFFYMLHIKL